MRDDAWLPFVDSLVDVAEECASGLCFSDFAFTGDSDDFAFDVCEVLAGRVERETAVSDSLLVNRTDGARLGRGIFSFRTHVFSSGLPDFRGKRYDVESLRLQNGDLLPIEWSQNAGSACVPSLPRAAG